MLPDDQARDTTADVERGCLAIAPSPRPIANTRAQWTAAPAAEPETPTVLLVGTSYKTAPIALREQFSLDEPTRWLTEVGAHETIDEVVLISTCNRVECVAVTRQPEAARVWLETYFLRELTEGTSPSLGESMLYACAESEAVRHLFRVAASLDSMVLGEPQILGQVKTSFRRATEGGLVGPVLSRLFSTAFATAKRVRSETGIGAGSQSVPRLAISVARQIFGSLHGRNLVLVGAGKMAEIALETLRGEELREITVVNRSLGRARELAGRFGAKAACTEALPQLLQGADVVLASTSSPRPLIDARQVRHACPDRQRPLLAIDLGVPRNIAADVSQLAFVERHDVDRLGHLAGVNASGREAASLRAEQLVSQGVVVFGDWLCSRLSFPTIKTLRDRAEAIRSAELAKIARRFPMDGPQGEAIEAMSRAIINKMLHAPVSQLRRRAQGEERAAYVRVVRDLFCMGDPADRERL